MAEIKPSYDTKRQKLREVVPLAAPLSMYVEPTRICNLKCFYCMHSTRGKADGALAKTGFTLAHMDWGMYEKLAEEIVQFGAGLKRVCFSGLGEPLTNPRLPDMIAYLRKKGFEGRIDIISNGLLLNHALSDALIDAGLNRLQISLQGLTQQEYLENCGFAADLPDLMENLGYFHRQAKARGKDTTLFVKIIDAMLSSKQQEQKFFDLFSPLCDTIFVEHLVIMEQQMGDHGGRADSTRNLNGEYVEKRLVCGVMFYFLQVNIDGETFPCSTPGLPNRFSMGCIKEKTLKEIWNGEIRRKLIRANLTDGYAKIPACASCSSCIAIADDTEYLDDCREEILTRFPAEG